MRGEREAGKWLGWALAAILLAAVVAVWVLGRWIGVF